MQDHKICIRCGNPVRLSRDKYEFFDRMHWICYHLEFEHSDYDPDEPCDDPACPWNRIAETKKMRLWDPIWALSIYSQDRHSVLRLRPVEENPSGDIDMMVEVEDQGIHKQVDFLLAGEAWEAFIISFVELEKPEPSEVALCSKDSGRVQINIDKYPNGQMLLKYSLAEQSGLNGKPGFKVSSGFQLDPVGFALAIKTFLDI